MWVSKCSFTALLHRIAIPIQPAFLVKQSSNLELLHRNTWKILTRKAASFAYAPWCTKGCTFILIPNCMGSYHGQILIETETDYFASVGMIPFVSKHFVFEFYAPQ